MQARHGVRLTEADWKSLESAQSMAVYLERARVTPLKRFLGKIDPKLAPAAIERTLRQEAEAYAGEVASWLSPRWRPAFAWLGILPHLPLLGAGDREPPTADISPLLAPGIAGAPTVAAGWYRHWQTLWPEGGDSAAALSRFAAAAGRLLSAADPVAGGANSPAGRYAIRAFLNRAFRGQPSSPVAVVAHLGLTFLDLERLRGGLLRRQLFGPADGKAAT